MAGNTLNDLREEFESFLRQDVSIELERGWMLHNGMVDLHPPTTITSTYLYTSYPTISYRSAFNV
jgi:hypothetical protein